MIEVKLDPKINISDRLQLKIAEAQHRIEDLFKETDGKCYLSFSGGKDSTVVLTLIKMCEQLYTIPYNSIPAVFSNTGIELDAIYNFVQWTKDNYYDGVVVVTPEVSFDWVLKNKGKPMISKMRDHALRQTQSKPTTKIRRQLVEEPGAKRSPTWGLADKDMHVFSPIFDIKISAECCDILKKKPFKTFAKENGMKGYMSGERSAEGGARKFQAKRRENANHKICTRIVGEYIVKSPIIDWSDQDVEGFISATNMPLSEAYTKYGMQRTGCFACPFGGDVSNQLKTLKDFEPNKYKASMFWLKDVYIAKNIKLDFDEEYEEQRKEKWDSIYSDLRFLMVERHRPQVAHKFVNKDKTSNKIVSYDVFIENFYLLLTGGGNQKNLRANFFPKTHDGFIALSKEFGMSLHALSVLKGSVLGEDDWNISEAISAGYGRVCKKWFMENDFSKAEWIYEVSKQIGGLDNE